MINEDKERVHFFVLTEESSNAQVSLSMDLFIPCIIVYNYIALDVINLMHIFYAV